MIREIVAPYFIFIIMKKSVNVIEMTEPGGKCSYFKMYETSSVSNPPRELKNIYIVDIVEILFLHYLIFCQY